MKAIQDIGNCVECEKPIKRGDSFEFFFNREEMPMHVLCIKSRMKNDPLIVKNGACERCHMELPPTGECCEEYR